MSRAAVLVKMWRDNNVKIFDAPIRSTMKQVKLSHALFAVTLSR